MNACCAISWLQLLPVLARYCDLVCGASSWRLPHHNDCHNDCPTLALMSFGYPQRSMHSTTHVYKSGQNTTIQHRLCIHDTFKCLATPAAAACARQITTKTQCMLRPAAAQHDHVGARQHTACLKVRSFAFCMLDCPFLHQQHASLMHLTTGQQMPPTLHHHVAHQTIASTPPALRPNGASTGGSTTPQHLQRQQRQQPF